MRVTGSELIGLVPLQAMLDAGKYFLNKQERSTGIAESEIIKIAVKSLGLDDLAPFDPNEKIIEYKLKQGQEKGLVDMTLTGFANETASESMAPGGGSISAYAGSLGISLAVMVANLSAHKRGWDTRWKEFSDWAEKGTRIQQELLRLVDEDTNSFNGIMAAFGLPKDSEEDKLARKEAIENATKYATEVPLEVMVQSYNSMEVIKAMAEIGNPNSITDAGVGALCARTAVLGAFLNVKINASGLNDASFVKNIMGKATEIANATTELENEIMELVDSKM